MEVHMPTLVPLMLAEDAEHAETVTMRSRCADTAAILGTRGHGALLAGRGVRSFLLNVGVLAGRKGRLRHAGLHRLGGLLLRDHACFRACEILLLHAGSKHGLALTVREAVVVRPDSRGNGPSSAVRGVRVLSEDNRAVVECLEERVEKGSDEGADDGTNVLRGHGHERGHLSQSLTSG